MPDPSAVVRRPLFWVILASIVFSLWFGTSAWLRHINFQTSQFDLGNMDSVVWHTLNGKPFTMTNSTQLVQESRLATHADFLLLAGVPLYWLWADPRMLMFFQILVVASGAIPVFLIGRRWLGPRWGLGFSLLYLSFPHLLWAVIFDFHAVTLAAPLILWGAWAMLVKRYWTYAMLMFLALLAKEEIGLMVGLLGIYWLVTKHHRGVSLATIIVGFAWSLLMIGYVIPGARSEGGHFALQYFSEFGDTPGQVILGMLSNPGAILSGLFGATGLAYLGNLLWPVGLLSVLGWPLLIPIFPALGINLLSANDNLQAIYFHYAASIVPFILFSAMFGLRWLIRKLNAQLPVRQGLAVLVTLAALSSIWTWAPLPGMRHHDDGIRPFQPSPYRQAVAAIKAQVPPNARVSVSNTLAPHFTHREWTWSFPLNLENSDVAIVLLGARIEAGSQDELRRTILELVNDRDWELRLQQDQLYFFVRQADVASR